MNPGELRKFDSPFIQCGHGWKGLYDPIIERCRKLEVHIFAVKTLHGGLRFHIGPTYGAESRSLYREIDAAELASYKICEICGEDGYLHSRDGFMQTLCTLHAKELKFDDPDESQRATNDGVTQE